MSSEDSTRGVVDDVDEDEDEDETSEVDGTLLSIVMFGGLVLFAVGCYLMGWWG